MNAPFERRGARCRSYVEVMRALWCDAVSEYKDEFYELPACRMYPKPVQRPHPPLHFGGESDAALRRVADLGQGWYGFNRTPAGGPGGHRAARASARRARPHALRRAGEHLALPEAAARGRRAPATATRASTS